MLGNSFDANVELTMKGPATSILFAMLPENESKTRTATENGVVFVEMETRIHNISLDVSHQFEASYRP